jgi:hypothetical protein
MHSKNSLLPWLLGLLGIFFAMNLKKSENESAQEEPKKDPPKTAQPPMKPNRTPTTEEIQKAFNKAISLFGLSIAREAERVYRKETNHFKSGQFAASLSPGQEATRANYPYGWNSKFWQENPHLKPVGVISMKENIGLSLLPNANPQSKAAKMYVSYPTFEAALLYLCDTLRRRGGMGGAWYALEKNAQKLYNQSLLSIKTTYTNV